MKKCYTLVIANKKYERGTIITQQFSGYFIHLSYDFSIFIRFLGFTAYQCTYHNLINNL